MSHIEDAVLPATWESIASGSHHAPHDVLGAHEITDAAGRPQTVIRVRRPLASDVTALLNNGAEVPLTHAAHGIWEGRHDGGRVAYRVEANYVGGASTRLGDPYRHAPTIGEVDLHLIT